MADPVDRAEADIRRADRARVFLEDEIFRAAWAEMETRLVRMWRTAPARDVEGRERLYQTLKAMEGLMAVIEGYVEDGIVARDNLEAAERERAVSVANAV